MPLSPEREAELARVCESCGHEYRLHHGPGGPCIAGYIGEDGKQRAAVCPCVSFTQLTTHTSLPATMRQGDGGGTGGRPVVSGTANAPTARASANRGQQARTSRPSPQRVADVSPDVARDGSKRPPGAAPGEPASCSKCKDRATVAVVRNGRRRIYCRPHGLAEALKRPRVEPEPLGSPLDEAWRAA